MRECLDFSTVRLDRKNPMPLYLQLADGIRKLIGSVTLDSHTRLPSERRLSGLLEVDPTTVRRAYAELLRNGEILRSAPCSTCRVSKRTGRNTVSPFQNIGIIIPQNFSLFLDYHAKAMLYIKGIIDSTAENKISTIMLQLPAPTATKNEVREFNEELVNRLVGIVHLGGRGFTHDPPLESLMKEERIPQVMVSAYPNFKNIGTVHSAPETGACALSEQLKKLHHTDVGVVSHQTSLTFRGPDRYFVYEHCDRAERILKVLNQYGFNCDSKFHCFGCQAYPDILKMLKEKKANGHLPTVYWCINDDYALKVIRALNELGIQVPEDISVVGFDGAFESKEDEEFLTTISLPFYGIGRTAVSLLMDYHKNGINDSNRTVSLQTMLMMKKTLSRAKCGMFMNPAPLENKVRKTNIRGGK